MEISSSGKPVLVRVAVAAHIATLTLNRPERLNAMGATMRGELLAALRHAAGDEAVRVVLLTGAGRAFCSGGDVKEMHARRSAGESFATDAKSATNEPREPITPERDQILLLLRSMPKPVIAAVNGVAAGAGMNLALGCDLRIASDKAAFGEVFVKRGLHPDWGGTSLLPQLVGPAKACELIFSGEMVPAAEALRIGLVNRVVPHQELPDKARQWAEMFAAGPPLAIAMAKRGIYRGLNGDLASALEYESYAQQRIWKTADAAEGIRAFVEKRTPDFQGK